jgi:phosphonate transport system ATP-binding protein
VNIAREFGDRFIGIRDGEVFFDGSREDLSMEIVDDLYYGTDTQGDLASEAAVGQDGQEAATAGTDGGVDR